MSPTDLKSLDAKVDAVATFMKEGMRSLHKAIDALRDRPEWEAMSDAIRTRRKSRETLVDAVARGLVREKRMPAGRGGFQARLLKTADLDKHFPIIAK